MASASSAKSAASQAVAVLLAVVTLVTVEVVAVVTPTLCPAGDNTCQSVLIEPTTSPGYVGCIRRVGEKCVGGNSAVAQAPFDPSSACPLTTLYGSTGLLIDAKSIGDQVRSSTAHSHLSRTVLVSIKQMGQGLPLSGCNGLC